MDEITSGYCLHVQATDEPDTLSQIAAPLARENVSIGALIQKGVINQSAAEVVILIRTTVERNVKRTIAAIEALSYVDVPVTIIRVESLHG